MPSVLRNYKVQRGMLVFVIICDVKFYWFLEFVVFDEISCYFQLRTPFMPT